MLPRLWGLLETQLKSRVNLSKQLTVVQLILQSRTLSLRAPVVQHHQMIWKPESHSLVSRDSEPASLRGKNGFCTPSHTLCTASMETATMMLSSWFVGID